jgi:hypothetical protein
VARAPALAPVLDEARDVPAWLGAATTRHLVEAVMHGHGMRAYSAEVR